MQTIQMKWAENRRLRHEKLDIRTHHHRMGWEGKKNGARERDRENGREQERRHGKHREAVMDESQRQTEKEREGQQRKNRRAKTGIRLNTLFRPLTSISAAGMSL